MITQTEKEILIKAAAIKEKERLEQKKKVALRGKSIYLNLFFQWLKNEYEGIRYFSKLIFEIAPAKAIHFENFQSPHSPDLFIFHSNKSFKGFAMYYFVQSERFIKEKEEEIKKLREEWYFAISVTSLDEAKTYFTEYMNFKENYLSPKNNLPKFNF